MTALTKPVLLDETGKSIAGQLSNIADAIRGYAPDKKEWSLTINTSSSNPILSEMGGDKTSWLQYRAKIGRYLVTPEGKAMKLDPENSRLFADGTEVDESMGNIMVRLPRMYYKVTTTGGLVTLTMCEREFGEDCEVIDEQWVGAYLGSVVSGKLTSRSNLNPTRSITISKFWEYAQANGGKWGLVNYEQRKMMVMLYLCEYLDLNSQAALGLGMTGTGDNWCAVVQDAKTGATAELGDECGKVNFTAEGQLVGGACHVSLFGIEDPYGWIWEMVQGCYFGSKDNDEQEGSECFIYEGNRMPTEEELKSHPRGQFRQLKRLIASVWVKAMTLDKKFDMIPASTGGSSTTYWGDYHYANNAGQLLLWGGYAHNGSYDGLVVSSSGNAFSYSSSAIGSRLAYHGEVEIVGHESTTNEQ